MNMESAYFSSHLYPLVKQVQGLASVRLVVLQQLQQLSLLGARQRQVEQLQHTLVARR